MTPQFWFEQLRQALYPERTNGIFKENPVEVALFAQMLESIRQPPAGDLACNADQQAGARSVEAMFEELRSAPPRPHAIDCKGGRQGLSCSNGDRESLRGRARPGD